MVPHFWENPRPGPGPLSLVQSRLGPNQSGTELPQHYDLAAAIALLAHTLAAQNAHLQAAQNASTVLVTSLTRLQEPNTFDGLDANKLQVFIL